jgi:fatty acid desaturase
MEAVNSPSTSIADLAIGRQPAKSEFAKSQTDPITMMVAVAVFAGYGLITWYFNDIPLWIAAPLAALCLAWYGSFQHETIHNHPTPSRRLNRALGSAPLALWLPYRIYRASHLQHHRHRGRHLTDADVDPESFFLTPERAAALGAVAQMAHRLNCTLAGRLLIGPALMLCRFASVEGRRLLTGDRDRQIIWLKHALAAALVVSWVMQICRISMPVYLLWVVYPSIALTHLRSFVEHRAHPDPAQRTVTVEANRWWSLLFLNNNLHIAHHAYPRLPWHQLPAAWKRMRRSSFEPALVIEGGYSQIVRRFLFKPVMGVAQPGGPSAQKIVAPAIEPAGFRPEASAGSTGCSCPAAARS